MLKAFFLVILFDIQTNVGHLFKYGIIKNFLPKILLGALSVFVAVFFLWFSGLRSTFGFLELSEGMRWECLQEMGQSLTWFVGRRNFFS